MRTLPLALALVLAACKDSPHYSDTCEIPDSWLPDGDDSGSDDSGSDDSGSDDSGSDDTGGADDSGGSDDSGSDDSGGPVDQDGDGYTPADGDCDDSDASVNPGAQEDCDTEADDNCDGTTNGLDALNCEDFYADLDGDGYGDGEACLCEGVHDYTAEQGGDCDDADADVHPGAEERCDDLDEDCDSVVDEDAVDAATYYADADGDGYGDLNSPVLSCDGQPSGATDDPSDCDDTDADVYPDSTATETPNDGVDQDCDGEDVCHDLDCDGQADLVYPNFRSQLSYAIDSQLYFASSGFADSGRVTLPTLGAIHAAADDLNGDGYVDLVFANHFDDSSWETDSVVYWGSSAGYSASNSTDLPTLGAARVLAQDLDADGFVDLVFANNHDDASYEVSSYVYWGSATGFSASDRTELPTLGAWEVSAADLDGDGATDLLFSNTGDDLSVEVASTIYWGSTPRYASVDRTDLPGSGSFSHLVADLNADGHLDVVLANFMDDSEDYEIDSYVYWGASSGFSVAARDSIPTSGATFVRAGDLDNDGLQDLVFSNYYDGASYANVSEVWYQTTGGYSSSAVDDLRSYGAFEPAIHDLDGDGYLDVVMPSAHSDSTYNVDSYIWWGSATGYSNNARDSLGTTGAHGVAVADLNGDGYVELAFAEYYDGIYGNASSVFWGSASGYSDSNRAEPGTTGAYVTPLVVGD